MKDEVKNIFKQSYAGHESAVDPAQIWAGIETKHKRRRPKLIWLLFLGLALIAIVFSMMFLSGSDVNAPTQRVNAKPIEKQEQSTPYNVEEKQREEDRIISNEKSINQTVVSEDTYQRQNDQGQQANLKVQAQKTLNLKPIKESFNSLQITSPFEQLTPTPKDGRVLETSFLSEMTPKNEEPSQSQSLAKEEQIVKINEHTLHPIPPLVSLVSTDFDYAISESLLRIIETKSRKGNFTIDVTLGAGLFTQNYQSEDAAYNEQRHNTEQPLESVHSGVLLGYQFNRFGLSTGFNYSRFNSRLDRLSQYFGNVNQEVLGNYDSNSFDQNLVDIATVETVMLYTERQIRYNKIETYSLPIQVNYRMRLGRVEVEPYAGLQFHLLQNNVETIESPLGELVLLDELTTQVKLDKIGGVNLNVPFRPSLQLRFYVQGMQREIVDTYLTRSLVGYHLGLGLRYVIQ